MPKQKTIYSCSLCGYQSPKWLGKCPDCDQWNSFYEEIKTSPSRYSTLNPDTSNSSPTPLNEIALNTENKILTGIKELDRVLGEGLVQGAVVLIGGDPGIGKSTLALQAITKLALKKKNMLYVSGEESLKQLRMRAERLGNFPENLFILAETSLEKIIQEIKNIKPQIIIIDSVQTVYSSDLESAPGSVSQIRETCAKLINLSKETDTSTFLIGHVTKDGAIAGPRVLEHMVDTVLYFEGDRGHSYRILRAVKNRFGSTDEIGVFEMGQSGLSEVKNPSELFISERPDNSSGSVIVPSIEGTRPILVEIQALVTPTSLSLPRRTAIGLDTNRASILIAVIEKKLGITMYNQDVFLNVAGGVRLSEPGIDLGVITAIVSSKLDQPVPSEMVVCGEVGLTGEVRSISQTSVRINEAERLGFTKCILPKNSLKNAQANHNIIIKDIETISEAMQSIFKIN